ncbi:cold-shock protein [Brachybacterium sp. DNPG3]
MATGIVTWFNSDKGYGFIAPEDGSADVFAHFSAIVGTGRRDLVENQRVEFETERGPKGLQAVNIRAI